MGQVLAQRGRADAGGFGEGFGGDALHSFGQQGVQGAQVERQPGHRSGRNLFGRRARGVRKIRDSLGG
jgi:hypothetical protein